MLLRFLFGDDISISHSRRDVANYSAALADELSQTGRDFSRFLDQWVAPAANELSKLVLHALDTLRGFILERLMQAILRDHSNSVKSASCNPDSQFIVTASSDRTARVCNDSTTQPVAELKGHSSHVSSAAYTPYGQFIITDSVDRTARIYPRVMFMPFDELMGLARKLPPRELTPEEREKYPHEPQSKQENRKRQP
jgi:WD40 repeat protein